MAEMKDMYRIVRYTYAQDIDNLTKHKSKENWKAARKLALAYSDSLKRYHRKPNDAQLAKLTIAAYKDGYLTPTKGGNDKVYFDVSRKGMHLVAKKFHFFRIGLWDESLKNYDKAQTVGIVIITSIITAAGGAIVGFALSAIFH